MSDRHCHKHHASCHFSHPNTSFLPYPNISHWLSLHKRRLYSFLSLDCCSHLHLFYGGHNSFQILYPVGRNRQWSTAMAGGIFYVETRVCARAIDWKGLVELTLRTLSNFISASGMTTATVTKDHEYVVLYRQITLEVYNNPTGILLVSTQHKKSDNSFLLWKA